jgi:hypothetical protein
MVTWNNASRSDRQLFGKIANLLEPHLIKFLFDANSPQLNASPKALLARSKGFSSGERVLIKLSIDLWCGQGGCLVSELFDYEDFVMPRLLKALYGTESGGAEL